MITFNGVVKPLLHITSRNLQLCLCSLVYLFGLYKTFSLSPNPIACLSTQPVAMLFLMHVLKLFFVCRIKYHFYDVSFLPRHDIKDKDSEQKTKHCKKFFGPDTFYILSEILSMHKEPTLGRKRQDGILWSRRSSYLLKRLDKRMFYVAVSSILPYRKPVCLNGFHLLYHLWN